MKKNLIDYLATLGLIMILTFQVWHTAGLYLTYSRLDSEKALFAAYFIAFTIEFCVVIFVYKGYTSAGAWFAICLFFVGILFNDNWEGTKIDVSINPFYFNSFYLPYAFVSSTLLQFMSSIAIWFLTDIHVKAKAEQDVNKRLAVLGIQETELNTSVAGLEQKKIYLYKVIETHNNTLKLLYQEQSEVEKKTFILKNDIAELEQKLLSMKKQKAGLSTRRPVA